MEEELIWKTMEQECSDRNECFEYLNNLKKEGYISCYVDESYMKAIANGNGTCNLEYDQEGYHVYVQRNISIEKAIDLMVRFSEEEKIDTNDHCWERKKGPFVDILWSIPWYIVFFSSALFLLILLAGALLGSVVLILDIMDKWVVC